MRRDRVLRELRRHEVPAWWRDAKLGIFVHWTPASVPAFAPVDDDVTAMMQSGDRRAMGWSPYTEWYENSLRFPDSPVARHHREVYGDRPYREFAPDWEAGLDQWDPDDWARTFAAAGARYVVLVTKHHDGYCLWPSEVPNPRRPGWHCDRDVVGELAEAVRAQGMRFGVYYSGGLDWTFNDHPIGSMSDMILAIPRGDFPAYADAHVRELIARYRPSVVWNDIAWPAEGKHLWPLLRDYYAAVPDGVINDRWMPWSPLAKVLQLEPARRMVDAGTTRQARKDRGVIPPEPPHYDVRTPEYASFATIQRRPWECVRGMDHSFGYNAESRDEHFLTRQDLLWSFADLVSKNGNLLLNVGPRGIDAQIPDAQRRRLAWLGEWMHDNADAVRATRPWVRPEGATADGAAVRFTARDEDVFAIVERPLPSVALSGILPTPTTEVATVAGEPLAWRAEGGRLVVDGSATGADGPTALRLRRVTAA